MMHAIRTVQLSQGPIHYVDEGSGPTIVFVHGLLADHRLWLPLLPRLSRQTDDGGYRCIAATWPLGAHTAPMKPDADLSVPGVARLVADFLQALDLRDVILVGNDSGGALVQMVCARYPERIAGMVLTTCDAYDVFPPTAFAYLKLLGHVPGLAWAMAQAMHHVPLLQRLPIAFGDLTDQRLAPDLIERWLAPCRSNAGVRHDVKKFLRSLSNRYTEEAAAHLSQHFQKPALLMWSTRCKHFPPRLAEKLHRDLPQAQLRWVDSRGVFLSIDHPQEVADGIGRFAGQYTANRLNKAASTG